MPPASQPACSRPVVPARSAAPFREAEPKVAAFPKNIWREGLGMPRRTESFEVSRRRAAERAAGKSKAQATALPKATPAAAVAAAAPVTTPVASPITANAAHSVRRLADGRRRAFERQSKERTKRQSKAQEAAASGGAAGGGRAAGGGGAAGGGAASAGGDAGGGSAGGTAAGGDDTASVTTAAGCFERAAAAPRRCSFGSCGSSCGAGMADSDTGAAAGCFERGVTSPAATPEVRPAAMATPTVAPAAKPVRRPFGIGVSRRTPPAASAVAESAIAPAGYLDRLPGSPPGRPGKESERKAHGSAMPAPQLLPQLPTPGAAAGQSELAAWRPFDGLAAIRSGPAADPAAPFDRGGELQRQAVQAAVRVQAAARGQAAAPTSTSNRIP